MNLAKSTILALVSLGLAAGAAFAGKDARIHGTVVDENGEPLPKATISITSDQLETFKETIQTNKKGKYSMLIGDATLTYIFTVEKDGFRPTKESVKLRLETTTKRDFTLNSGASDPPVTATGEVAASASNAAIRAYNEGATALRAGDYAGARGHLERALEKDSELAPAHGVLALALNGLGEHQAAVATADRALELRPGEPNALKARYDAYRALGDDAKAEEAGAALAQSGANAEAAKLVYNEGAEATRLGDRIAAIEAFEEAARLDPTLTAAADALSGLYFAEQRFDEAAKAAERVLESDPARLKALKIRYESYRALQDQEMAQEALKGLAVVDPDIGVEAFYNQGVGFFNNGQTDQALSSFQQALDVDPSYAKTHFSMALAYASSGENAKAKEHLQKFVDMAPDDPDAASAKEMIQYLE